MLDLNHYQQTRWTNNWNFIDKSVVFLSFKIGNRILQIQIYFYTTALHKCIKIFLQEIATYTFSVVQNKLCGLRKLLVKRSFYNFILATLCPNNIIFLCPVLLYYWVELRLVLWFFCCFTADSLLLFHHWFIHTTFGCKVPNEDVPSVHNQSVHGLNIFSMRPFF